MKKQKTEGESKLDSLKKELAEMPENTDAGKPARVRLASTTVPGLWVKTLVSVVKAHGLPLDPNGEPMVPQRAAGGGGGISEEERARRREEKEKEKQRIAAMSPEELAEFKRSKREERTKKRAEKKAAEREELIKQIKAEIAAGAL